MAGWSTNQSPVDAGGKVTRMSDELKKELEEARKALEEAKKAGMSDEEKQRLSYLEEEHKKLIKQRDEAKEKARIEEEAKLLEQGKFKEVAEAKTKELEALTEKLAAYAETVETYTKRDEERLTSLIDKVPEDLRDLISDDLPLSKRLQMAEKLAVQKESGPGYRPPGGDASVKTRADLKTPAEKADYINKHGGDAYLKLPAK